MEMNNNSNSLANQTVSMWTTMIDYAMIPQLFVRLLLWSVVIAMYRIIIVCLKLKTEY
jgi:hypothetical protein